ncbi:hypothetical protein ACRALDRAFT_1060975 [Sodiomyces alcalophilus JCM 7366]|uniref:uncharacterized protein n=1 Tax=Sodiomyces alcalophilus JCM 7366 TaxID=591952 RepID=UPI0039B60543
MNVRSPTVLYHQIVAYFIYIRSATRPSPYGHGRWAFLRIRVSFFHISVITTYMRRPRAELSVGIRSANSGEKYTYEVVWVGC